MQLKILMMPHRVTLRHITAMDFLIQIRPQQLHIILFPRPHRILDVLIWIMAKVIHKIMFGRGLAQGGSV